MKVSVIIPAYNAAETIIETLQSLLTQSFPHWKAIVVDDGSVDNTAVIVADFIKSDKRIYLARQSHLGGAEARNKGIELAKSDWLLFLDADDWISPLHLERLTTALTSDPTLDAVHCGWTRVDGKGGYSTEKYAPDIEDLFPVFAQTCAFQPNACIVRRTVVEAVGGFDTSLFNCQDWDLWQRITRTDARFGAVGEVLARYRTRPGSVSLQIPQLLENGLRVITQGHSPDPRVANPKPIHASGAPKANLSKARLHFVCWPAGIALGSGQDARPLLDAVRHDKEPELDPARVAMTIFEAALLPSALPMNGWDHLWPRVEHNVVRFLARLTEVSETVQLASHTLQHLEQLILDHSEVERPLTIGATHAVRVEVTKPIPDISSPSATQRLRCELELEGETLGTVELPVSEDFVAGAAIADAIAAQYAWPILGRFFEHTLYPSLRIEEDAASASFWRGSICLGTGLFHEENNFWSVAHDQVGWLLFLQELWNRPDWSNEKFYDSQYVEPPSPCPYFADRQFNAEVSDTLLDVVTNQRKLEVTLAVGGAKLGCVIVSARQNRVRAQEIRAALATMAGFDLCRLAVRQGLIGQPLTDPTPLRVRLLAAARQRHLDEPGLNPLRKILISLQKSRLAEWLQK